MDEMLFFILSQQYPKIPSEEAEAEEPTPTPQSVPAGHNLPHVQPQDTQQHVNLINLMGSQKQFEHSNNNITPR